MPEYSFSVIVATSPMTHEEILDVTDTLGNAGCLDALIRGHKEGIELLFERSSDSLENAISSAISDIESAGHSVSRLEMERECIPI